MPNYIDLLRSHYLQGKKPQEEEELEANGRANSAQAGRSPSEPAASLPVEEPDREQADASAAPEDAPVVSEASPQEKQWLNQCIHYTTVVFKAAAEGKPCSMDILSDHIKGLLTEVDRHPDRLASLELMISGKSAKIRELFGDLVVKSIIIMLYALKVGLQLRLNADELHALVLAGMLHHIGMAQIPESVRLKREKLSRDELKRIHLAPEMGARYLRSCGITDNRILSAASQAQERYDGSGPEGLKGSAISRTARAIGLLSTFEALIHYRAYRKRMLPRDAIRELLVRHKDKFDPTFLKCLIDAISLYPVGTYIQLNSGDIGQVVRVHRRLPLRPIVHLTMDRHGNGIVPRDINLQKQPNLMVERCMYPEDVAEIAQHGYGAQSG